MLSDYFENTRNAVRGVSVCQPADGTLQTDSKGQKRSGKCYVKEKNHCFIININNFA